MTKYFRQTMEKILKEISSGENKDFLVFGGKNETMSNEEFFVQEFEKTFDKYETCLKYLIEERKKNNYFSIGDEDEVDYDGAVRYSGIKVWDNEKGYDDDGVLEVCDYSLATLTRRYLMSEIGKSSRSNRKFDIIACIDGGSLFERYATALIDMSLGYATRMLWA